MRVAIVHYDISMRTGAQRLVLALGSVITGLGHETAYFTTRYDSSNSFPEFGNQKIFVSQRRQISLGRFKALNALVRSRKMVEYGIQRFNPDLFVFSSNYYLPMHFKPSLIYCHYPERLLIRRNDWIRRALHYPVDVEERRGFRSAFGVISNSSFTKKAVKDLYGVNSAVAFPGVDLQKFNLGIENKNRFVLTVNRIVPNKNLELAINSIGVLKSQGTNVSLIIAGTKQPGFEWYLDKLIHGIRDKNLDKEIQVRIDLPDKELIPLYQGCSIFLYTPELEHFGYGPVEAMASGRPVIASPGGGPSETVLNGETGFIVPPDPKKWAKKIGELLDDDERRRRMGILARERVEAKFSMRNFARVIEESLNRVIVSIER